MRDDRQDEMETQPRRDAREDGPGDAADEALRDPRPDASRDLRPQAPDYAPGGSYDFDPDAGRPYEGEPELVPSWAMRFWDWLSVPSLRPDRSPSLDNERHGRLDRLDIWIAVLLLIVLLSTRVYRLDQPQDMHFDEVYHARTAMEFLQDWKYGIVHDIYEWTHPHFAKYAIAGGITAFDGYQVTGTSNIGVSVKAAAIEPRLDPLAAASASTAAAENSIASARTDPGNRIGDRVYVATSAGEVRAYDLETKKLVASVAVPDASTLYMASCCSTLYVGTTRGEVLSIDTSKLDLIRLGLAKDSAPPTAVKVVTGQNLGPIAQLWGDGDTVVAIDDAGQAVAMDSTTKTLTARTSLPKASNILAFGSIDQQVVYDPTKGGEAVGLASTLAGLTGVPASQIQDQIAQATSGGVEAVLNVPGLSGDQATNVQTAIDQGKLPGVSIVRSVPRVLVANVSGLVEYDGRHLSPLLSVKTQGTATSITATSAKDYVYLSEDAYLEVMKIKNDANGAPLEMTQERTVRMPGAIGQIYDDPANEIVHAIGRTQDGTGWTVYAVDTRGNSVFDDAKLAFQPVAMAADVTAKMPNTDRESLLVFDGSGNVATVDIGQFSFSYRIVGVIFGAFMAVCLYLLTRVLFKRRSVGLIVAALSVIDGMFFVQSRIAMNDTYVGGWLLAAYLVFAIVWGGVWKSKWAFWLGMPLVGTFLGLALASKWVGLYAIASIGMLVLIRSALGRVITILGLAVGTGILGYLALFETPLPQGSDYPASFYLLLGVATLVAVFGVSLIRRARTTPDRVLIGAVAGLLAACVVGLALMQMPPMPQNGGPNFTFFVIMLVATAIASAVCAYRPVAWTREEMWFGIVVSALGGLALLYLAKDSNLLKLVGLLLLVLPAAAFYVLGRFGFGPLAPPPPPGDPLLFADPASPPPPWWLRLGSGFGIPAAYMAATLLVLPIAIYVASYIPWVMPWQAETAQAISDSRGYHLPILLCFKTDAQGQCTDAWPTGHTGQTLVQLTQQMYEYHNDLRSPHPASSPWWSWPMDLKPVWFQSDDYSEDTLSRIYDGGNLPMWWLAIPAMGFLAWQAYRRRSLALTLVGVAFFWQWLSWSRIDRASFQYHFYTSLPFFLMALAYFVAELWHGPSARTWLLARVSAAVAVVGAPLLWLVRVPLCGLGRVNLADGYAKEACGATVGDMVVTNQVAIIVAILLAALVALAVILYRIERTSDGREPEGFGWIVQLAAPVVIAGILLLFVGDFAPEGVLLHVGVPAEPVALGVLLLLAVVAWVAITARDARKFTLGILVTGLIAFLALYPNLSALPLPGNIASAYNGFLPTWLYGYQFGVNQETSQSVSLFSQPALYLTAGVLAVAGVVAYAAWVRRVIVGYQRREEILGPGAGRPSPERIATSSATGDEPA